MNSRVHRLKTFDSPGVVSYIKRDDELSFGISGSKLRKYSSLIPSLIEQGIEEAVLAGTSYSNHILSLSQSLREHQIKPTLFFGGKRPQNPVGNFIFTSLLVPPEDMHWVAKGEEDKAAHDYATARQLQGNKSLYIPTGARMKESLPGALTLVTDIVRNEKELGIEFDHIIVDSGTGMTAIAVILGFSQLHRKTHIHVIQMASTRERFELFLKTFQAELKSGHCQTHYTLYQPSTARSFGSVNASVWRTVAHMARSEGILVDPTYNAKLFAEGQKILQKNEIRGNVLFVHSGGGLALSGFMEDLGRIVRNQVK